MGEVNRIVGRHCSILALTGIYTVLAYGFMSLDFGGRALTSGEAWVLGVAQPYVIGGVVLVVLSLLLFLDVRWARWPVLFWFPVTFGGALTWSIQRGVGTFDLTAFILEGLPVVVIWLWGTWRAFFRRPAVSGR